MSHTPHVAPSLFELAPVRSMEDRAVEHAYALLRGDSVTTNPPGMELTPRQRDLLRTIADRRGSQRAISALELSRRIGVKDDRMVRQEINELRRCFGCKIGSSRHAGDSGYYLITNMQELAETCGFYIRQIKSEAELVRSMCDEHELREIAGQLKFNLNDPLNGSVVQDAPQETHHAA